MYIEQVKELKREAENKILQALVNFEKRLWLLMILAFKEKIVLVERHNYIQ